MTTPADVDIEHINPEHIKMIQEFISSYNRITEMCFSDCINDFTKRELTKNEEKCGNNCVDKFSKVNQRLSTRFQEYQFLLHENLLAKKDQM